MLDVRLRQRIHEHPRITLAAKAALATAAAWALALALGGTADQYPYYAPLGAIIAVGTTVAGSVRESVQSLVAIMLGAAVAVGIGSLGASEIVTLGIVVAVATLVGGWWRLGSKASWVPLAAMFVLIIGDHDPVDFAIAYLGLVTMGAVVAIAVDLAFPPLPLTPTQVSVTRLRKALAAQLDDLAEGLLQETPPDDRGWRQRRRAIRPLILQMHDMVAHATESRRGNWRAPHWRQSADRQYQQARALEALAFLVEEMTSLVTSQESAEREDLPLGPSLRPYAAHAFEETAELLRTVDGANVDRDQLREADTAVRRLAEEVRSVRADTGGDLFGAGTIVITLRRAVGALAPAELEGPVDPASPELSGR